MALKSAGIKNCLQACSIICMHHFKRAAGFQLRQEYSSRHLATDDDESAELGSPLVSGLWRPVKLMTEKNDHIKKNNSRWNSSGSCSTVDATAGTEYVQLDSKRTFSNNLDDGVDETNAINARTSFVTVANIPPSIKLPKVVEALSRFGKISNSSMRTLQDGSICCDREEATQKALSPGAITINNVHLPIHRGCGTVTVRIMNVCSKTSDSVVHEICRSRGFLVKVEKIVKIPWTSSMVWRTSQMLKTFSKGSLQSGDAAASTSSSDDEGNDEMNCNSGLT